MEAKHHFRKELLNKQCCGDRYQLIELVRTALGRAEPRAKKYAIEGWTALHFAAAVPSSTPYPPRHRWFHQRTFTPHEPVLPQPVIHHIEVGENDVRQEREVRRDRARENQILQSSSGESTDAIWVDLEGWNLEEQ